jgi:hypothetical protein
MLGKLLKYEFRATAPVFGLLYAALLFVAGLYAAIAALGIFFRSLAVNAMMSFMQSIYVIVALAVLIVTIILIAVRFYRMLGDEGYLWFTLPATANQHILSKLIVAFVWTTTSTLVIIASVVIITFDQDWVLLLSNIADGWRMLVDQGFALVFWVFFTLFLLLGSWLSSVLQLYAAMAIGPNLLKSRFAGTALALLILYFINQMISTFGLFVIAIPMNSIITGFINLSSSNFADYAMGANQMIVWFSLCYGLLYLVLSAGYYLVARYFMSKKLNLA